MPKATDYRWIAYFTDPLGGFTVERHTSQESVKAALIAYGRATGFYQDLQTNGNYGPTGTIYPYTEQGWESAVEFKTSGCPFDYPYAEVLSGPRGGVRIVSC
jgi:hypothetical protein